MQKSFNEYFKDTILKNKTLIIVAILVTVLAFGVTVTNFSIGVDDPAVYHYLHSKGYGNMIQQGRLSHVIFDKLTGGRLTFIPFLNDFIGAALFGFSALVFCGLFQYVTDGKLNNAELMAFAGIYISYPIISEKFIFNLDVIVTMLSYVCVAYSVALVCEFFKFKERGWRGTKRLVLACLAQIVALGSYESFVFVYVCGVFAVFVIECVVGGKKLAFKDVILRGLVFLLVLAAAMIVYYSAVFLVQIYTNQLGLYTRPTSAGRSLLFTYYEIKNTIRDAINLASYLPMKELYAFSVIWAVLIIIYSIIRKSFALALCGIGLFVSNFGIHFVADKMFYRTSQTLCLFVAVAAILVIFSLRKFKPCKHLMPVMVCWLIFVQLADLNLSFYNDYSRYKKEEFAINTIATSLVSEYDISKPVVFTYEKNSDTRVEYLTSPSSGQSIGSSMLCWGAQAFFEPTSPIMLNIFKMHGYNFLIEPTTEQAEQANKLAKTMECYPNKGYIREFDDFIIVNI